MCFPVTIDWGFLLPAIYLCLAYTALLRYNRIYSYYAIQLHITNLKVYKNTMALNLTKTNLKAQAEDGYEFELLIPETNDPTDGFVKVRGSMSEVVQNFARKKYRERQQKEDAWKRNTRNHNKDFPEMTLEEAEEFSIESASIRVLGWRNIELEEGKPLEFNAENLQKVLKDHSWIRTQIIEQSDSVANFTKS